MAHNSILFSETIEPSSKNLTELAAILNKINPEEPVSDTLFMDRYQFKLLENIVQSQNPLGKIFKKSIVVCYAKLRKPSEQSECRIESFSEEYDGCPLPSTFDVAGLLNSVQATTHSLIKQLSTKYHLLPVSETVGRQILSLCVKASKDCPKFPFICICHDKKNPKAALLLGSTNQNETRFIFTYEGVISKKVELPRLERIKENHLRGFLPSFTTVDVSVYAYYDFPKSEGGKRSDLTPITNGNIVMECYWKDVFAILEPVGAKCTCTAKMKAVSGSNTSGAFSLYNEIQFLEALQEGLQTGFMTWPSSNLEVMKKIKEFINEQKNTVQKREKQAPPINSNLENFEEAILSKRNNLDFTEELWMILKDCSSFEKLQEALTFVYNSLKEFFMPPYVYPKSISTLAMDIKAMMEKSVSCPTMSQKFAVKMLLEIGVEKLRRDYIKLFSDFIPFDNLNSFLEPCLLSKDAVTCLKKMHSALELAVMCIKKLNISGPLLRDFLRSTLKQYSAVPDIDLSHIFSFQIPVVKARQLLNQMRPTIWELSLLSKTNDFMKQSIHRFITEPIEEHIYAPVNYHPQLMLETASYMYSSGTLVQSDAFKEKLT